MWAVKACFATVLLRQLQLVSAAACPTFPKGAFRAAAAYRTLNISAAADVKASPQSVGHISLSNLQMLSSSGVTCGSEADELKAFVRSGAGSMEIGSSSCSLMQIVVIKHDGTASSTAKLRLDFEKCTGGPSTASVLMDVVAVPDATATTSMMPFWRQVCGVQTTTPAQSLAQLRLTFSETQVGNSSCTGDLLAQYPTVTQRACKELCIADVEKYATDQKTLTTAKEMCKGYSYNTVGAPGTPICNLYKKMEADPVGLAGTFCYNLSAQAAQFHESTAAPPSAAEVLEMQSKLPKLNITVAAHSGNILTFVSTDKCFQPFNWITLQNYAPATMALTTVAVGVKQSEWAEFLSLIPSTGVSTSSKDSVAATVLADRAKYGAPAPAPAPAAMPDCAAPPAKPASMTMTVVLITVLVISAAGCFWMNHGNPMSAGNIGGAGVAPQDPAAQALVASNNPGMSGNSGGPPSNFAGPGMMSTGGPSGPGGMMQSNVQSNTASSGPGGMMSTMGNAGPSGPGGMMTGPSGPTMGARMM